MAGRRMAHLSAQIRQKLGMILIKDSQDPRFALVTITGVVLNKDLASAKVRFSCLDTSLDSAGLAQSLNHAAGFFGQMLARSLDIRKTPRLRFYFDHGFAHADQVERLLAEIKREEGPK